MDERRLAIRRDLAHSPSAVWLWLVPAGIVVAASVLQGNRVISLTVAGSLWTLATFWIGLGCALNARRCGRVHCMIDSILFPLLGVIGVLNLVGLLSFSWNVYWAVFVAILVASFVPEFVWKKYA